MYELENGPVVLKGLLARILEHLAHVLYTRSAVISQRYRYVPQPYTICAFWLLGTMLPFAFLTTLAEASAAALELAASMLLVCRMSVCDCTFT